MKKIITILFTLIIAMTSCNFKTKKEYYYIEEVEEKGLFGGLSEIKDREIKTIKAESDSAAYIEAYRSFVIAKKVKKDMEESGMETVTLPIGFKLLTKDGKDISQVKFANKEMCEKDIYEQVYLTSKSLPNDKPAKFADNTKHIKGLAPVDIYLNMEKQGFKTTKSLSKEWGNIWTSTNSLAGIDYKVDVYSTNIDNVETVTATAMVDVTQKKIIATQQFFIYISSLPYDSANPQRAGQWVSDNFNNDKTTVIIGDAMLTIYAPSIATRILVVEKTK